MSPVDPESRILQASKPAEIRGNRKQQCPRAGCESQMILKSLCS
jgi:hypothetical protein